MCTKRFVYTAKSKWIISLSLLLFIALCLIPVTSFATEEETEETNAIKSSEEYAILLVEAASQQVIQESGADTLCNVAGLTKMPALLTVFRALENGKLGIDDDIHVSQNAASIGGPSAFIEANEVIKASSLLKAAVMIGAGDAIVALGEHIFGSENAFIDAIHIIMSELGINIQLNTAVGTGVKFSPRMLASIGTELMKSNSYTANSKLTYEKIGHSDGRETELASSNKMLRNYSGCSGVMTGSSPADGYCGVFSVTRGDTQLIAVVLNCKDSATRFDVASDILDQAYATTRAQKLAFEGEILAKDIRVIGGVTKRINLVAKKTVVLLLDKTEPALKAREEIPEKIYAPLTKDQVVGYVYYETENGEERGKVELIAEEEIMSFSFRDIVEQILAGYLRL